jgi:hypothetical protein
MHVAGHWSTNLKPGHPDYVCCRCLGGVLEFFYLELKRKDAVTERGRRRAQRRFAQFAADDGFIVCLMPDGLTDPYGWFLTWYAERYT